MKRAVCEGPGGFRRSDGATEGTTAIDLGGASRVNGDGLLLQGHLLYVVQNFFNKVRVVYLEPGTSRRGLSWAS